MTTAALNPSAAVDEALAKLPRLTIDPFDEAVLKDPYPFQQHLRELGPVFWVEEYGHYGTAHWNLVHHILNTWQDFTATHGVGLSDITKPDNWREKGALVEEDPPIHSEIRMPMQRVMSPPRIRAWRDYLLKAAAELFDKALPAGEVEAVKALTEPYVMNGFPAMLGVDPNWPALLAIGDHNFNAIGPQNAIFKGSAARVDEVASWYKDVAAEGAMAAGGLGEAFFKAEQEGAFKPGMAYNIMRMLLRGGFDTTISGLGSTLLHLAREPGEYDKLRADPKLAVKAFEEALRLESPAQTLFRTANEGTVLGGVPLKAGVKVQYWLAAANRDPQQWDEPDSFRVDRDTSPSVVFGGGVHKCIGSLVARVEAECFLLPLLEKVKRIELTGEPQFRLSNSLRSLDALPLRFILD